MNENNIKTGNKFLNRAKELLTSTAGMVLIVTIVMTVIVHFATGGNFYTAYNLATYTRTASFTILVGLSLIHI